MFLDVDVDKKKKKKKKKKQLKGNTFLIDDAVVAKVR
jgi:hypothetical protein